MKNKLKVHRAIHSLTQEQLAKKLGVTRQSIVAIEKGKFNPSTQLALKMASVLETTVHEIFELESGDWDD